jgi:putative hydrolase of HD superfamily
MISEYLVSMDRKDTDLEKMFDFLSKAERLKSTIRYNKTTSGREESSAEHSWRLSLMTFLIADELELDIDVNRSLKIALVHDIPEAICGDVDAVLIAEGKFSNEKKQENEIKAMDKLRDCLPKMQGDEMHDLWQEYDECKTREARFVKALDKIETLTQLAESGHKIYDKPEFIANYADPYVNDFPELKPMLRKLKKRLKAEFEKGGIPWKKKYD